MVLLLSAVVAVVVAAALDSALVSALVLPHATRETAMTDASASARNFFIIFSS
jgi:hypothetical protein